MYDLYKHDYIPCVYCHKMIQLYNCKNHLKSKKCLELQRLMTNDEHKKKYLEYNKLINKMKSELRLSEEEDEEDEKDDDDDDDDDNIKDKDKIEIQP